MYETQSPQQLEQLLAVNFKEGLTKEEAYRRLQETGPNCLTEKKKRGKAALFFAQFNDPLIAILMMAAFLSFLLNEFTDGIIVLIIVLVNAIVGAVQEAKAERALEALKELSSPTCLVRREGKISEIPSLELVPGDCVILEAGRLIPADLRILEAINLKTEEASLTGESSAIEKQATILTQASPLGDRVNMAFMSTSVVYGRGEGVVVATGMKTEIGKIAKMLDETETEMTPLQKRLADLGKVLGIVVVSLCILLFGVALWQKRDMGEMLITSICFAVAAIPEGLPAAVTIVLAIGVQKMMKVHAIVRRLPSVETLGAVSFVCSDKTGTLTQNRMTVVEGYCLHHLHPIEEMAPSHLDLLMEGMCLCSDAQINEGTFGDPTEIALLEAGKRFDYHKTQLEAKYPRLQEIPFDSHRKMMSTMHRYQGGKRIYTKGALEKVLDCCSQIYDDGHIRWLHENDRRLLRFESAQMARKAERVLALAYRDTSGPIREQDLIFVGFVGMIDPPRPEVKEAVSRFQEAGITSVMITGDHRDTALAIAKEIGIAESEEQCIIGEELDRLDDQGWKDIVFKARVYARVTPEHKVRIVQQLKQEQQIVAMTGDGINDAPSLKAADIGIAMGITGTDVAKGAADMVLSDDNFASIEKAVEEGRGIYANIKKAVLFLLSSNIGEVFTMFLGVLFRFPVPLIAIHILWVNLITDTLPALALGADPKDPDIMKEKPRRANESLFAHGGMAITIGYGIVITFLTVAAFLIYPVGILATQEGFVWHDILAQYRGILTLFSEGAPALGLSGEVILMRARSYAFTALGMSQLFHMIGMSNVKKTCLRVFKNRNIVMFGAFVLGLLLQVAVTEIPFLRQVFQTSSLSLREWMWLLLWSALPLFIHEWIVALRFLRKPHPCKARS